MREGLLERIREVGHWRINYRPKIKPAAPLRLAQCREAVEKSRVSIRGWDFPHISVGRADGTGGFTNAGDHVENWTEWYGFREFWRMYRSTQFLAYLALREDVMPQEMGGSPNARVLDI